MRAGNREALRVRVELLRRRRARWTQIGLLRGRWARRAQGAIQGWRLGRRVQIELWKWRLGVRRGLANLRQRPAMAWFMLWTVAFLVYLGIGLTPAEAKNYQIIGNLTIPSAGISTEVAQLTIEDRQLNTPDEIAGAYREQAATLLIGHRSGVFANLTNLNENDIIEYSGEVFAVQRHEVRAKERISMGSLLNSGDEGTLILMTCAGEALANGDATERLIVTAQRQDQESRA